jgi:hypothetical protein
MSVCRVSLSCCMQGHPNRVWNVLSGNSGTKQCWCQAKHKGQKASSLVTACCDLLRNREWRMRSTAMVLISRSLILLLGQSPRDIHNL